MITEPGRRDRKKSATRLALRNAAVELVSARGFTGVTIEDIANAADVSTRTFFNYFSSKEAAVVGEDPASLEELATLLERRPSDEPIVESVQALLRERCERVAAQAGDASERQAWLRRMKVVHADPQLRAALVTHLEAYEQLIVRGVAARLRVDPAKDPYPALLASAAMAAMRVAFMFWARSGASGTPAPLAERAFAALASGLAPMDTSTPETAAHRDASAPSPIRA